MILTTVHRDPAAPARERWRVLRAISDADGQEIGIGCRWITVDGRWITVESFPTEREANAFARGFSLGAAYAPAPEPIPDRIDRALELVKSARDDYRREVRELRAKIQDLTS